MAIRSFTSFTVDPAKNLVVGRDWTAHHQATGVRWIRSSLRCGPDGSFNTDLFSRALDGYRTQGIEVLGLFDRAFVPDGGEAPGIFPNAPLNGAGDLLNSDYVDRTAQRVDAVCRPLVRRGLLRRIILGNEWNLLAFLAPGVNPDPTGEKANAVHPHAAAAMAWQGAMRALDAGIGEVIIAGLSVLPDTGLNRGNAYYAAYMAEFYKMLASVGQHAPFPWKGIAVNTEGWWTPASLKKTLDVLRGVMATYKDTSRIIMGEWGQKVPALAQATGAEVADTVAAIDAEVEEDYFFQWPSREPWLGRPEACPTYAAGLWHVLGNQFFPLEDTAWGRTLRPRWHAAHTHP